MVSTVKKMTIGRMGSRPKLAPKPRARIAGFTLIELMTTVAMSSVLVSVAVPSFQDVIRHNQLTADANRFLTSMMLARSEAIKRGTATSIAAIGGSWQSGWTVSDQGTSPPTVLRNEEALKPSLTLTGGNLSFQYDADGSLTIAAQDMLTLCDTNVTGETGRQISVNPIGHVTVNGSYVCP